MFETKFLLGDIVKNTAANKYYGVEANEVGCVMDLYLSKNSGEIVYEVLFDNGNLMLMREGDLRRQGRSGAGAFLSL